MSLPAQQLVNGYYLNELLLKLFARHDPHADVFALSYSQTLDRLKREDPVRPLRLFEKTPQARSTGLRSGAGRDVHDDLPIEPQAVRITIDSNKDRCECIAVMGETRTCTRHYAFSLAREELTDAAVCADAWRLLRAARSAVWMVASCAAARDAGAVRKRNDEHSSNASATWCKR